MAQRERWPVWLRVFAGVYFGLIVAGIAGVVPRESALWAMGALIAVGPVVWAWSERRGERR